eukprot:332250-Rhodomonas_salina.2
MSVAILWVLTVVCTRLYLFHNAYIHHLQTIEDERWLLFQCQDPAFFANLKQHVSLCQQVEENARRTPVLVALNETVSVSSLCGAISCWDLIYYVQNGGMSMVTVLSVTALALVAIVIPTANIVSRWIKESAAGSEYTCIERGTFDLASIPAVRDHEGWLLNHCLRSAWNADDRNFHKKVV